MKKMDSYFSYRFFFLILYCLIFISIPSGSSTTISSTIISSSNSNSSSSDDVHYNRQLKTNRIGKIAPIPTSYQNCELKLQEHKLLMNTKNIPLSNRWLIIYHVGDIGLASNSYDIASNNLKIFTSSIKQHSIESSSSSSLHAFYLFNVIGGIENPLIKIIPSIYSNVGILEWTMASSDMDTHLRTMRLLSHHYLSNYSAIMFINQGVRGPLTHRSNGLWLQQYQQLFQRDKVAMIGSTLSCEVSPHIQTHIFALKTSIVSLVMREMKKKVTEKQLSWKQMIASLEVGMTGIIRSAGYNVASLLYDRRGYPIFEEGKCLKNKGPKTRFDMNPTSWCDVTPDEVIFVKWGGEPMRTPGFMCNTSLANMIQLMNQFQQTEPEMGLTIPEALMGGSYYDLFKEYNAEAWLDRNVQPPMALPNHNPKVCFLIRVTSIKENEFQENAHAHLMNKDLELLLTTLRRQSNTNWLAFIYLITNTKMKLEEKVLKMIEYFQDPRVKYHHTLYKHRQYSINDGGSKATDYVLKNKILSREDCSYITITTSDNSYGSHVVENVLKSSSYDMIISPIDSRRFAHQDHIFRNRLRTLSPKLSYEDFCIGIDAMLEYNQLSYAMRPIPSLGRIDIAAVFFHREKWIQEGTFFKNFSDISTYPCLYNVTDPYNYPCLNNAGMYLTQYLVRKKQWTYSRLPIDGMKSLIFHGNSPTQCIGSGNVWLDHFQLHHQKCLTHKEVLRIADNIKINHLYDFDYFDSHGEILGTCLRMRNSAFLSNYYNKDWVPLEQWKPVAAAI